jgi:hypothetical protein
MVNGASTLQLADVRVEYCGQYGLARPCVMFDRMLATNTSTGRNPRSGLFCLAAPKL